MSPASFWVCFCMSWGWSLPSATDFKRAPKEKQHGEQSFTDGDSAPEWHCFKKCWHLPADSDKGGRWFRCFVFLHSCAKLRTPHVSKMHTDTTRKDVTICYVSINIFHVRKHLTQFFEVSKKSRIPTTWLGGFGLGRLKLNTAKHTRCPSAARKKVRVVLSCWSFFNITVQISCPKVRTSPGGFRTMIDLCEKWLRNTVASMAGVCLARWARGPANVPSVAEPRTSIIISNSCLVKEKKNTSNGEKKTVRTMRFPLNQPPGRWTNHLKRTSFWLCTFLMLLDGCLVSKKGTKAI